MGTEQTPPITILVEPGCCQHLLVSSRTLSYKRLAPIPTHFLWVQEKLHNSIPSAETDSSLTLTKLSWMLTWIRIAILVLQIGYIYHLFVGSHITAAANVGSHFILNNLLMFGFVLLWVHSHLWWALVLLIINFFNLSSLYFRHSTTPLLVHIPVVSGPLAWSFVAIFWCGAAAANAHGLVARVFANIMIWGFLGYGLFFLVAFNDWTMGLNMTILTGGEGPVPAVKNLKLISVALMIHQILIKVIALQWIFAITICGLLFVATCAVAIPGMFGKQLSFRREASVMNVDRERQPLLNDEA
jgi:hypothetical protein